jgi:hypothetical protein
MIVRSSSEVPRRTLAKRFPLPRNFALGAESRVERGKTWPAPGQASRVKLLRSTATTPTAAAIRTSFTVLRDALFTHPTAAEGLTVLLANVTPQK